MDPHLVRFLTDDRDVVKFSLLAIEDTRDPLPDMRGPIWDFAIYTRDPALAH